MERLGILWQMCWCIIGLGFLSLTSLISFSLCFSWRSSPGVLLWPLWEVQRHGSGAAGPESRGPLWPLWQDIFTEDCFNDCNSAGEFGAACHMKLLWYIFSSPLKTEVCYYSKCIWEKWTRQIFVNFLLIANKSRCVFYGSHGELGILIFCTFRTLTKSLLNNFRLKSCLSRLKAWFCLSVMLIKTPYNVLMCVCWVESYFRTRGL